MAGLLDSGSEESQRLLTLPIHPVKRRGGWSLLRDGFHKARNHLAIGSGLRRNSRGIIWILDPFFPKALEPFPIALRHRHSNRLARPLARQQRMQRTKPLILFGTTLAAKTIIIHEVAPLFVSRDPKHDPNRHESEYRHTRTNVSSVGFRMSRIFDEAGDLVAVFPPR